VLGPDEAAVARSLASVCRPGVHGPPGAADLRGRLAEIVNEAEHVVKRERHRRPCSPPLHVQPRGRLVGFQAQKRFLHVSGRTSRKLTPSP
jgi:hypothetical protein